jgi:hypothetical protein
VQSYLTFVLLFAAAFVIPLMMPILAAQKWGWRGLLGWYALFAGFCALCAFTAPRVLWVMIVPWMMAGKPFWLALLVGGRTVALVLPQLLIGLVIAAVAAASGRWPQSKKA